MVWFIFSFIFSFSAPAQERESNEVFEGMRALLPPMCTPSSSLRKCFAVSQDVCTVRVVSAFEACLRDQRITYAGRVTLDLKSAILAEEALKVCLVKDYAKANMHNYVKSNACDRAIPKNLKAAAKAAPVVKKNNQVTAFEDPTENKKDIYSRYNSREENDRRTIAFFVKELAARRGCENNPPRADSESACFKKLLGGLRITSSVMIAPLLDAGTEALVADRAKGRDITTGTIELQLAIFEKTNPEDFHLADLRAYTDQEKVALNQMRVLDSKLMNESIQNIYVSIDNRLRQLSGSFLRAPAGIGELRMRAEKLRKRTWVYPPGYK